MGHWVVLRRLHVPVLEWWFGMGPPIARFGRYRIGMLPIGASVYPDPAGYAALSARQRMAVALGGPIGSAVYGLSLLVAASQVDFPIGRHGLESLAVANFTIALFNLLPMPPLDGWALVEAMLDKVGRPLSARAKAVSARLGNGLVYGLGFFVLAKFIL